MTPGGRHRDWRDAVDAARAGPREFTNARAATGRGDTSSAAREQSHAQDLAVSIDLYIIASVVWKSVAVAAALSGSLLGLFVGLWFVYPQSVARRRERARRRR
jgi:hypothetical protein